VRRPINAPASVATLTAALPLKQAPSNECRMRHRCLRSSRRSTRRVRTRRPVGIANQLTQATEGLGQQRREAWPLRHWVPGLAETREMRVITRFRVGPLSRSSGPRPHFSRVPGREVLQQARPHSRARSSTILPAAPRFSGRARWTSCLRLMVRYSIEGVPGVQPPVAKLIPGERTPRP